MESKDNPKVRPAPRTPALQAVETGAQVAAVADLAREIWQEHYVGIIGQAGDSAAWPWPSPRSSAGSACRASKTLSLSESESTSPSILAISIPIPIAIPMNRPILRIADAVGPFLTLHG